MLINIKDVYTRLIKNKLVHPDVMLAMIDIQVTAGKITQADAEELVGLLEPTPQEPV